MERNDSTERSVAPARSGVSGMGGIAGTVGGASIGAVFGPIGLLAGGTTGAAVGLTAGEVLEPLRETEFWRERYRERPYSRPEYEYERDYLPAYRYGSESRRHLQGRTWDVTLERELHSGWAAARAESRLDWDDARDAVRDGWIRAERTYSAYSDTDGYFASRWRRDGHSAIAFENVRPAYRYGTYARRRYPHRRWNAEFERELATGWVTARGGSSLDWEQARTAVHEAWLRVERSVEQRGRQH